MRNKLLTKIWINVNPHWNILFLLNVDDTQGRVSASTPLCYEIFNPKNKQILTPFFVLFLTEDINFSLLVGLRFTYTEKDFFAQCAKKKGEKIKK